MPIYHIGSLDEGFDALTSGSVGACGRSLALAYDMCRGRWWDGIDRQYLLGSYSLRCMMSVERPPGIGGTSRRCISICTSAHGLVLGMDCDRRCCCCCCVARKGIRRCWLLVRRSAEARPLGGADFAFVVSACMRRFTSRRPARRVAAAPLAISLALIGRLVPTRR